MLQARAKLSDNKVNGPEDAIVSEIIKQLPYGENLHCSEVLPRKIRRPDGIPKFVEGGETGLFEKAGCRPDYRAIALTSVMSQKVRKLRPVAPGTEAKPKHVAKIFDDHNTHGWLTALLREMSGMSGMASFESVESRFSFNGCLRQGSVEAPRLWQKMASQIWATVEEEWMKKRKGVIVDVEGQGVHQICSLMWADNFWIMSHSEEHMEQMLLDLFKKQVKQTQRAQTGESVVDKHVVCRRKE